MSETRQTSWRKAFDSPYLASWDLEKPITLTISHVVSEKNKMRKNVTHNVAYFQEAELRKGEKMKPMILNATNCKTLQEITGHVFIEGWMGARVAIYVEANVKGADGQDTQGLRIMKARALPTLTVNHEKYQGAVGAYRKSKTLDAVKRHFNVPAEVETAIIEAAKAEAES